jgi:hypothetical protein
MVVCRFSRRQIMRAGRRPADFRLVRGCGLRICRNLEEQVLVKSVTDLEIEEAIREAWTMVQAGAPPSARRLAAALLAVTGGTQAYPYWISPDDLWRDRLAVLADQGAWLASWGPRQSRHEFAPLRRPPLPSETDQLHGVAVLSLSLEPSNGRGDARVPGHRGQPRSGSRRSSSARSSPTSSGGGGG